MLCSYSSDLHGVKKIKKKIFSSLFGFLQKKKEEIARNITFLLILKS